MRSRGARKGHPLTNLRPEVRDLLPQGPPPCPRGALPSHWPPHPKHAPASPALEKVTPGTPQGSGFTRHFIGFSVGIWMPQLVMQLAGFSAPHPVLGLRSGAQLGAASPALHQLLLRPSYNWTPAPRLPRQTPLPPSEPGCPPWARSCIGHSQALLRNGLPAQSPLAVPPSQAASDSPQHSAELWLQPTAWY